jgi:hypothetical protein
VEEEEQSLNGRGRGSGEDKKLIAPFPSSGDASIDDLALLLEVYKEYPINPIQDIWEKLDKESINLLIGQTLEHHRPQEERDKELAFQKYNELKEEKGLQGGIAIGEQVVLASNLLNFEITPE